MLFLLHVIFCNQEINMDIPAKKKKIIERLEILQNNKMCLF